MFYKIILSCVLRFGKLWIKKDKGWRLGFSSGRRKRLGELFWFGKGYFFQVSFKQKGFIGDKVSREVVKEDVKGGCNEGDEDGKRESIESYFVLILRNRIWVFFLCYYSLWDFLWFLRGGGYGEGEGIDIEGRGGVFLVEVLVGQFSVRGGLVERILGFFRVLMERYQGTFGYIYMG